MRQRESHPGDGRAPGPPVVRFPTERAFPKSHRSHRHKSALRVRRQGPVRWPVHGDEQLGQRDMRQARVTGEIEEDG